MSKRRGPFTNRQRQHAADVVGRHESLARWCVERFLPRLMRDDFDDALQLARMAISRAAVLYEPDRKLSFSTYAVRAIRNELWHYEIIRRRHGFTSVGDYVSDKTRRHEAPRPLSLEWPDISPADDSPWREMIAGREPEPADMVSDAPELISAALRRLPRRERQIIHARYWNGDTQRDVAANMGLTRTRIYQLEQRALRRMREELEGIEL